MTETKTKTAAEIGAEIRTGDRVIRRTESKGHASPLVGDVLGRYADGRVLVRWEGVYPRWGGGWKTLHGKVKPSSLLPATDESIAASQRRIYLRQEKGYAEIVAERDRRADNIEARGADASMERRAADVFRDKLREVRRQMEAMGEPEPPR